MLTSSTNPWRAAAAAGRLDIDTTGLVMTDDGQWSHRIPPRAITVRKPIGDRRVSGLDDTAE